MSNLSVRIADLADYLKTLPADVAFPVIASEDGQAFVRVAIELPTATVDPVVQPGPALATLGEATPAKEVIPSQDAQQAKEEVAVEVPVAPQAETVAADVAVEAGMPDAGPASLGDVAADAQGAVAADTVADAASSLGNGGFAPAAGVDKENA